jgi:hypothetical protein
MHKLRRRLDFQQRLQPVVPCLSLGQKRPAHRTGSGMSLEIFQLPPPQLLIECVAEKRFKLPAPHSVVGFLRHHITCL